MDTFVTPLCCKVFCSFRVGIFFFQNTLLDFVARIIKTVQIMVLHVCIILGFNNTHRIFFWRRRREEGGKLLRGIQKEAREEEERLPKDSNKKVVFLVPS